MNLPPTSSSRQELDYQQEYSDNELDTATNLNLESGLELTPNQQHLLTWLNNLTIHDTVSTNSPTEDNLVVNEQSWCELRSCSEKITLINSLVRVPELGNMLSQPLKRKLNMLSQCHLSDNKERLKALRTSISIGNRILCEFLVKHTDSHQVISNLWNSVRSRGCQFLGPAIQEEILQLALLALEDGEALTRKVLILFIMQRLVPHFPYQTSKTAIGHVIQILYRASCFNVIKREGDSSLMQLKEEFRTYESLRREHDSQIVSIALENGLRISPEQWSSLLYGDNTHKSHMQSIIDKVFVFNINSTQMMYINVPFFL
ncbi:Roquin-1 [Blomia tropicalis]|nr:Roquin-1 [Blomia tropicalis]